VPVRDQKLARLVRREPWVTMVNMGSSAGGRSCPAGHATPLAPAAHAVPSVSPPDRRTVLHCARWATQEYGPVAWDSNKIPFPFHFGLNASLNFENSYLPIHSSKNHETSLVGFLISISIYENIKQHSSLCIEQVSFNF
jgi:hypothetical protein